jgi:hypothetical protein
MVIGPGRRRARGDVEVHVHPHDWTAHGHSSDRRYERVVAHVCYMPGQLADGILPPGAVQIALKPHLESDRSFSFECIDVTAYPYAPRPSDPRPCSRILSGLPPGSTEALLDAAGEERLRVKTSRIEAGIRDRGRNQQLFEEVLYALGYKHNRAAFRSLARRLPTDLLRQEAGGDPARAYALLMGVAGLLPKRTSAGWDRETVLFVRQLWDFWWKQESRWAGLVMAEENWQLAQMRPQNHPARRMAAAAGLFVREEDLASLLLSVDTAAPAEWARSTVDILSERAVMDYWDRRLSFGGSRDRKVALVGPQRLAAILSNVVIPFLAAEGVAVSPLLETLPPEQDNALVRQTADSLLGHDHNPAVYRSGLRQQGLLQVFHDFCLNERNACRDCALARTLQRGSSALT